MLTLGTTINKEKLEELCQFYPDCHDFLYNFFTTCQGYDLGTNLVNYSLDLETCRQTEKWRTTDLELYRVFFDVTGRSVECNFKNLN